MQYLDGIRLKRAVKAGYLWLYSKRELLNAINVFPVADGDTGTNMALTLQAAVAGAYSCKTNSLRDVANSIALYSLRGARGNSGVILSQYFKGIAEFIGKRERLHISDIAGVFSAGAESAYGAMSEPREGTILTVLREIGEHLHQAREKFKNIHTLLESAMERGRKSVAETREKLKVLADAGVVDAGAQGFMHFIEGINNFIKTGELTKEIDSAADIQELPRIIEEHSRFRYCSEFLVKGSNFDIPGLKSRLRNLGDSVIVASSGAGEIEYLRIHIHTDKPQRIKGFAQSMGTIENEKIDDMKSQNRLMRLWRKGMKRDVTKTVRIVTDSTCDLPEEVAEFYDIEIVPMNIIFGADLYKDGVDIDRKGFYKMLSESEDFPKTSQPSPEDFSDAYKNVFARGDAESIISLHLSANLSGTYNSALMASVEFGGKITLVDSGTVSLGLGMMAIVAAEMARDGDSPEKITGKLAEMKKSQKLFFTLESVDYLIKGGRVGKARGFLGKVLGLKPILTLVNGEVRPLSKARNREKIIEKIMSLLPVDLSDGRLAVAHAADPSKVDQIMDALKGRYDLNKILTGEIGPTVGTHCGPGTWGLFYMKG
ncbi:MAG: DegV family EDD domain-containing protein [Candidatus Zixiibacteriota bacterium]|nr:MAG: DegV family EDD domain-containing protein [candidate division Zixibacteria bacterium]